MITISIPTSEDFWKRLTIFAYVRWRAHLPPDNSMPVGVPGNRDPDHPCAAYEPAPRMPGDWGDCQTDGHYLCAGCAHRALPDDEDDAS